MLPFLKDKSKCCGCYACYSACPVHCISMRKDGEGFWYPFASEECIGCGKCKIVCPINNHNVPKALSESVSYAAVAKSKKVWKRSSSGGAFSELCRAFDDGNTLFVGAIFEGLEVVHKAVYGIEKIGPLCKSKYVQSKPGNVYMEIKNSLLEGHRVVFCGTPCQVAGLRNYLCGVNRDNLLLIDLICHGVGSPSVFSSCCDEIGKKLGTKVTSYQFRAKRNVFEANYLCKITISNGKEKYLINDPYMRLFLSQDCLRPSCGSNCIFRTGERQGDITIADLNALSKVLPELVGTKLNYSAIIINTPQGERAFLSLKRKRSMKIKQIPLEDIKKYNPLFYRQTSLLSNRDQFFDSFIQNKEKAIEPYCGTMTVAKRSLKGRIFSLLPVFVRRFLLIHLEKKQTNGKQ